MTGSVLLVVGHSTGGIVGHVGSLAAGLPAHGWAATVATSAVTSDRLDAGDAAVELVWPGRGPLRVATAVLRLRRLAAAADVVHAHGHQAGLLAALVTATLPRRRRPPLVVSWHNAVLGAGPARRARALLERLQVRRADLVTGASADLVERAAALGAPAAELAPVAAPSAGGWTGDRAAERSAVAAEVGADPGAAWLLTVSRVAPQKNLGVLVDAAARLRRREGVVWLVAGDGDAGLLRHLRERADRTGAPVRFLGARRDVVRLMALADLFVLTSDWEARALVVQEAMAAGTPVVVTAVGGLPELVGDAGVLVDARDAAALAAAVDALLDDPLRLRELGEAARARFAELPGPGAVVSQWADRYRRLLAW